MWDPNIVSYVWAGQSKAGQKKSTNDVLSIRVLVTAYLAGLVRQAGGRSTVDWRSLRIPPQLVGMGIFLKNHFHLKGRFLKREGENVHWFTPIMN